MSFSLWIKNKSKINNIYRSIKNDMYTFDIPWWYIFYDKTEDKVKIKYDNHDIFKYIKKYHKKSTDNWIINIDKLWWCIKVLSLNEEKERVNKEFFVLDWKFINHYYIHLDFDNKEYQLPSLFLSLLWMKITNDEIILWLIVNILLILIIQIPLVWIPQCVNLYINNISLKTIN